MKKITLLTVIVFFTALVSQAQINKGSILLGGTLSYSSQKSELTSPPPTTGKSTGITISPVAGIAVNQNLIMGIGVLYQNSENGNGNPETFTYGGNIFLRKYLPLGKGFHLFGESAVYVNHSRTTQQNIPNPTTSVNYLAAGLSFHPGISYAVNRKIHLELEFNNVLSAYYSYQKMTTTGTSYAQTSKAFSITANASSFTQPAVGILFLLAK